MILEHRAGEPILMLTPDQIWGLLERRRFGRLVVVVGEHAEIFPINYAAAPDRTLVFRTAPGTKLASLAINEAVLFQVDLISARTAWSVTVRGQAEWLQHAGDVADAEGLELQPWVPAVTDVYVRVVPEQISGRHFQFGPHMDRDLGEGSGAG